MRADYSIQRRILASGAVLLLIVGLFLFWMVRWSAQQAAEEAFDRVLGAAALTIADTVSIEDGDLSVDLAARRLSRSGREIPLTAREYDLLIWLLQHPGEVADRQTLIREVWGWEVGDISTVTVHVRRLREKVEADPGRPRRLVTVFGRGYRWDPDGA